jgi:Ni,Fe-hydrogenase III small subunit
MLPILNKIIRIGLVSEAPPPAQADWRTEGQWIQSELLDILGRALSIRQVDAGSCNGCELEIHALNNPYYNAEGLGIRFVASPRHADLLLVTGPVSRHMQVALRRTYDAMPEPRLVVAVGDCGCTGGVFGQSYASCGGVSEVIPVDVQIPGCPPTPIALLQGIRAAVARRGLGSIPAAGPGQPAVDGTSPGLRNRFLAPLPVAPGEPGAGPGPEPLAGGSA